ncbi:hypothetical protein ACFL59_01695 [Planctomycetota bacterium]
MRIRIGQLFRVFITLVAVLSASTAFAQGFKGFHIQTHRPTTDPHGYITLNGARSLKTLEFFASAGFNSSHKPLTSQAPGVDLIKDATYVDLVAGLGVAQFGEAGGLSIGVDVPLILDLHGVRFNDRNRRLPSGNVADIRVNAKATLADREESVLGLFGQVYMDIPSGEDRNFLSNREKFTFGATVGAEKQYSIFRAGVEVGYEWIDGEIKLGGIQIDDKLRLTGGLGVELLSDLWLMAEIHMFSRAEHLFEAAREYPMELGGAFRYTGEAPGEAGPSGADFYGILGASSGLNKGIGAPDVRVFGALGLTF